MPDDIDILERPVTPEATPVAAVAPADKDAAAAPAGKSTDKPATPADREPAAKTPTDKEPAREADDDDEDDLGFEKEPEGDAKPQASWPEDWREKMAGGNEKLLKVLKRIASPDGVGKSYLALQQKLSSGEYKRAALPENATPEEQAAWRKENGIPDAPDGYELPAVKGHEWSDDDKPIVASFLTDLHAAGTPQPIAQQALKWYAGFTQKQAEARAERDRADSMAREDALRAEWGPGDYRPHVNLAREVFQDDTFMSPDLRTALAGARTADGGRLILHPDFTRFLAEQGLARRGAAGLISGEQGARMGSRIDEIKKIRDTDLDRYYAEGLDRELLELNEKMESGRSR